MRQKKIYIYHKRNEENVRFFYLFDFFSVVSVSGAQIYERGSGVILSSVEVWLVSNSFRSTFLLRRRFSLKLIAIAQIRAKLRKYLNPRPSFNRFIGKTRSN